MTDTQAAPDPDREAREAFEKWNDEALEFLGLERHSHYRSDYAEAKTRLAWHAFLAAWNARSLTAAAALLRAAGWTVEEPRCKRCMGIGRLAAYESETGDKPCPTCNGTGKRIG